MDGRCAKHQFEAAESVCRACGNEFCGECLVYSFGPKKPPFCVACALAAAGVRTTAGNRPVKPKKELKKETRARRKEARASLRNRTANVEIEWSMAEDPTEGLTEEDLLLPSAPTDAPAPPPPSFPLTAPDPTEPAGPIGAIDPVGDFEATAPVAHEEPPQFLLHPGEAPDGPGIEVPPPAAGAGPTLDRPDGREPAFADLTALLPEPLRTAPTGPTFAADGPGFATEDRDRAAALADLGAIAPGPQRPPEAPAGGADPAPAFNLTDLTPGPTPPNATPTSPDPAASIDERPAAPRFPAATGAPPPRRPMFASPPPPGPADAPHRSSTPAPLAPPLGPPGTRTAPPGPDHASDATPTSRRPLGQPTRAPSDGRGANLGPRVDTGRSGPPPPPGLGDIAAPGQPVLPTVVSGPSTPTPPGLGERSRPAPPPPPLGGTAGPARPAGPPVDTGATGPPPPRPGREDSATPASPPGTAPAVPSAPARVDADHLFTADTPPAPPPPAPALGADSPWDHVVGRHPLRVRDLLDDPDDPDHPADPQPTTRASRRAAEPSFFAPVTPEQLGDDPWPPAR